MRKHLLAQVIALFMTFYSILQSIFVIVISVKKQQDFTSRSNPAGNYMFKVNNRNTRTRCEICSKLTIKTPERCQWDRSRDFIVKLEHI